MTFLYNIAAYIGIFLLKIISLFNKKIRLFMNGRKETFSKIESVISKNDKIIWFHCASLGEFEQGRPIIEKTKDQFPNHKILLTFFSPSGYEVRKNYELADVIAYLPLDTKSNAKRFLKLAHPEMAIFVKYEFWPNILSELKKQNIKTILVSGIFRKSQAFFKPYGAWMRKSLNTFSHFFVQNKASKQLLNQIGFNNVTLSGDTRFDRVFEITKQDNRLDFIEKFKHNKYTLVAGSSWQKDEEFLIKYINNSATSDEKFIIAPHNIEDKGIENLQKSILKTTTKYSDKNRNYSAQVFIVDTIGILTKIYSYADAAYVGGGFGTGIHNILEPATFGVPIIIGPNYQKFQEAVDLVKLDACKVIDSQNELDEHLKRLFKDVKYRENRGAISKNYIKDNIGSTQIIIEYMVKEI